MGLLLLRVRTPGQAQESPGTHFRNCRGYSILARAKMQVAKQRPRKLLRRRGARISQLARFSRAEKFTLAEKRPTPPVIAGLPAGERDSSVEAQSSRVRTRSFRAIATS